MSELLGLGEDTLKRLRLLSVIKELLEDLQGCNCEEEIDGLGGEIDDLGRALGGLSTGLNRRLDEAVERIASIEEELSLRPEPGNGDEETGTDSSDKIYWLTQKQGRFSLDLKTPRAALVLPYNGGQVRLSLNKVKIGGLTDGGIHAWFYVAMARNNKQGDFDRALGRLLSRGGGRDITFLHTRNGFNLPDGDMRRLKAEKFLPLPGETYNVEWRYDNDGKHECRILDHLGGTAFSYSGDSLPIHGDRVFFRFGHHKRDLESPWLSFEAGYQVTC